MKKNAFRVLFIYPGLFMQTALPLSIASLSSELKAKGIEVKVFDTVLYQEPGEIDENEERAEHHHSTKKLDYASAGIIKKKTDLLADFSAVVREYNPDLIALNAVESTFSRGIKLTRTAKKLLDVPVIAGGVFPTLAPEVAINEESIDVVCVGEGEEALSELCEALAKESDYSGIHNLWLKKDGHVKKNPVRPLRALDDILEPDFTVFDRSMFYKPMQGNLFKTIPVELSRGCPYQCTYCAEPSLKKLYRGYNQAYFRKKSMPKLFSELHHIMAKYKPDFFYFATETFLAMDDDEFEQFIKHYRSVKLPFWIQTRPETITRERIVKLKEVGLYWLTVGIECGNEEFRKKYLKRTMSNDKIFDSVRILADCDQGASLNSIIGFPHETRALILETIMLNRALFKLNSRIRCNISLFTPFRGCELYDICIEKGFLDALSYIDNTNISGSLMKLDSITKDELAGLYRTLPLYIYLPDEYLDRVKTAELLTREGDRVYEELNRKVNDYLM